MVSMIPFDEHSVSRQWSTLSVLMGLSQRLYSMPQFSNWNFRAIDCLLQLIKGPFQLGGYLKHFQNVFALAKFVTLFASETEQMWVTSYPLPLDRIRLSTALNGSAGKNPLKFSA